MNSSNKEFALSDAVMASMSVPGVTEPVPLNIYKKNGNEPEKKSLGTIRVVDGGLADNTGLTTLFDVFFDEINVTQAQEQSLTALIFDANNASARQFATLIATRPEENYTPSFSFDWPYKGADSGLNSAFMSYDLGQRNELALLLRRTADKLKQLNKDGRKISIQLIPIALAAAGQCGGQGELPCVETRYEISEKDEKELEESAAKVLDQNYADVLKVFLNKYDLDDLDEFESVKQLFPAGNEDGSKKLHEVISIKTRTDRAEYNKSMIEATEQNDQRKCEEEKLRNKKNCDEMTMKDLIMGGGVCP